jgi:hypothetical protein
MPTRRGPRRAHALLDPVATTVDLDDEDLMHAATAVSGSAPAYLYAFVEALEAAGAGQGLDPAASAKLARATIVGAAALLGQGGEEPAELRKQVTSPGGTTAAALGVLMGEGGFGDLLPKALDAAVKRSVELGGLASPSETLSPRERVLVAALQPAIFSSHDRRRRHPRSRRRRRAGPGRRPAVDADQPCATSP